MYCDVHDDNEMSGLIMTQRLMYLLKCSMCIDIYASGIKDRLMWNVEKKINLEKLLS